MFEIDLRRGQPDLTAGAISQEFLAEENAHLRLMLEQAEISAQRLLATAGIDATERAASDNLQKLILEELHHRIRNTLAMVGAIASQSLRHAPSTEHARHAIEGRLLALSRAHDLLLQAQWTSADLGTIIQGAVEAFDNPDVPRFSIQGPGVPITSGAVIAIAMTLNELCTNTTKFGALSAAGGHVDIGWAIDEPALRLHLTWSETGGPLVQAPTKRSFGTRLIETLAKQLKGDVKLAYAPSGFIFALDIPLASVKPMS
jgi:two-component sensor histidine kinase